MSADDPRDAARYRFLRGTYLRPNGTLRVTFNALIPNGAVRLLDLTLDGEVDAQMREMSSRFAARAVERRRAEVPVTEASMREDPGMMQSKRLYAEQLVDAIIEVARCKAALEDTRRNKTVDQRQRPNDNELQAMQRYSHAREIAIMLVVAEEAGRIL